jgi:hypothetical protein
MSTTRIFQGNIQEWLVRPSKSEAGYIMEIHKVTLDGSGDGNIYSKIDRIVAAAGGVLGSAAPASGICVNVTASAGPDADTGNYTYPVYGTASVTHTFIIIGEIRGE